MVGGAESLLGLVEVCGGESQLVGGHAVRADAPEGTGTHVEIVLFGGEKLFAGAQVGVVEVVLELLIPAGGVQIEEVVEHARVCSDADFVSVLPSHIFDEGYGHQGLRGGVTHIAGFEGVDGSADAEEFLSPVVFVDGPIGADAEGEVGLGDRKPLGALVRIDAENTVIRSRQRRVHRDRSCVELGVMVILRPRGENRHAQNQQQCESARAASGFWSLLVWRTVHHIKVLRSL